MMMMMKVLSWSYEDGCHFACVRLSVLAVCSGASKQPTSSRGASLFFTREKTEHDYKS